MLLGITSKDVKGKPTFTKAMLLMIDFIQRTCPPGKQPVLIAHNGNNYDFKLLTSECLRAGLEVPSDWLTLDTLPLARVSRLIRETWMDTLYMDVHNVCVGGSAPNAYIQ